MYYHLIQISNELNSDVTKPLYFNFLQEHANITQHFEKFFKLLLSAFYIRQEMNISQHQIENKPQKLQQLSSLYEDAWNINPQEFPYYKYYKIVNELKSLQSSITDIQNKENESITENIFKYEILPVKILECLNKKTRKKQTNYPSFPEKANQQIIKEKQELNDRNNNNNNFLETSNIIPRVFSSKIRVLKTNLKNPIIINKTLKVTNPRSFVPNQIIDELFPLLSSINTKNNSDLSNAIHYISEKDFISIQDNIAGLKKVNLVKVVGTNNKICFWLNLFNLLVIFTLIYTQIVPNSINRWKEVLKNAQFDIGGYELSLCDLYFQLLNVNFLIDQAFREKQKVNKFINRFAISGLSELEQYLIVFGLYLPGFNGNTLVKFNSEDLFNQLKDILKNFISKNVKFNKQKKHLLITEEFLSFDMNFVFGSFRLCKELLDEEMYNILNEPRYSEIKMLSSEESSRMDEFM